MLISHVVSETYQETVWKRKIITFELIENWIILAEILRNTEIFFGLKEKMILEIIFCA